MMASYKEAYEKSLKYFNGDELAAGVFVGKYALTDNNGDIKELTPDDMHKRLAKEFARIEKKYPNPMSEEEIYELLKDFKYVVAQGSPMNAIGNDYQVQSSSNCFVLEPCHDSYSGILKTDQEQVQIMKRRGGAGHDISRIRPKGLKTNNAAKSTDGIAIFMERFSNTCREVAQCVAEGERVLTKNGLVKIENVVVGDLIWTKGGWVKNLETFRNGKKEVYKVVTKAGYEVVVSKEHIFQTFDENGNLTETRLKDLEVGSNVVLCLGTTHQSIEYQKMNDPCYVNANNKPINCTLPSILTEKLAYVLGYSYGDGCVIVAKDGTRIGGLELACSNNYPEIKDKIKGYVKDSFNYDVSVRPGDGDLEKISINNRTVGEFLKYNLCLKQKSELLEFPKIIIDSPIPVKCAFIAGYFDADGYASGKKKGYCFSSVCLPFIKECQKILLSMGMMSKIHSEDRSKLGWSTLYNLCVVGKTSQERFVNLFSESIKVGKSNHISKRECWNSPFKAKTFGIKHNKYSFCPDNTAFLSLNTLNQLETVGEKVVTNLVQDSIVDIKVVGEIETYDLSLEEEHLFWCEGFYLHNSGRRGALMLTISVHHPEIETFINIKKDKKKVTGANISVRLTDEFMNAVKNNDEYELRWPIDAKVPKIKKNISARDVWKQIVRAAWESAEPGLLFWDNVLKTTPSDIYENFGFATTSTNPCAELVLSNYDSCRLLVLNLFSFVNKHFNKDSNFDFNLFKEKTIKAQRLMDDLIDLELEQIDKIIAKVESDPEPENVKQIEKELWKGIRYACETGRRTGLGITALGDTLAALNVRYGSQESIEMTEQIYKALAIGAYTSTIQLAKERGSFPIWNHELEKDHVFVKRVIGELDSRIQEDYKKFGRRNIALTTTAPTGSVSMLTQTTSGIEPAFLLKYTRRKKVNPDSKDVKVDFVDELGDKWQEFTVYHHNFKKWMDITGKTEIEDSPYFKATSNDVDWEKSVEIQAVAQKWICHAISKTCNLPNDATEELVNKVYMKAWESGCKGFTVYRDGCRSGVLVSENTKKQDEFVQTTAPKRGKEMVCDIHQVNISGDAWTILVGMYKNKPYEIFGGLSKFVHIPKKFKEGLIVKTTKKKNGGSVYELHYGEDKNDLNIIKDISDVFENPTHGAFTRTLSLALRHGAPIQYVVEQLQKDDKDSDMYSFSRVISRVLKKYIVDGTKTTDKKCENCGAENALIYKEGCKTCVSCGHSKCG